MICSSIRNSGDPEQMVWEMRRNNLVSEGAEEVFPRLSVLLSGVACGSGEDGRGERGWEGRGCEGN